MITQVTETASKYPNIAKAGVTHIIRIQGTRGGFYCFYKRNNGALQFVIGNTRHTQPSAGIWEAAKSAI